MWSVKYLRLALVLALVSIVFSPTRALADVIDNSQNETTFIQAGCNGEPILVETHFHGLFKTRITGNFSFTIDFAVNAHGSATNLIDGTQYLFNDTYHETDTFALQTASGEFNWHTRMISPGKSDNIDLFTKYAWHIDGGNLVIDRLIATIDCHGQRPR